MDLYRIKRVKDGKFYVRGSHTPKRHQPQFSKCGVFFSSEATIKKHLYYLCCDFGWYVDARHYDPEPIAGPFWERLEQYEVSTLVVLDSETIKQPAVDFMGILAEQDT